MSYRIEIERGARKAFAPLRKRDRARIAAAIDALAQDPRPAGCRPVEAAPRGTYRIRVGDCRVIYTVLDGEQVIIVGRIVRRGERTYEE